MTPSWCWCMSAQQARGWGSGQVLVLQVLCRLCISQTDRLAKKRTSRSLSDCRAITVSSSSSEKAQPGSLNLGYQDADIGHRVRGEAEQTGQQVLAKLLHGHAVLLHYGLQKKEVTLKTSHTDRLQLKEASETQEKREWRGVR
ncbi:hypothetical protein F7725_017339 [Dissostichus mawsoni]|uniref:Uncharacterized protein n=1 Tax=Dissostichus mawsoni TaxID=36200 RepID=A0A7J5Z4U6_DISMA|nr:hypothetical protein F7725_017339 [Dissostichus mawsoni]